LIRPRTSAIVMVALLLLALQGRALPQTLFEKLVMPGPLVQGHAKLEEKCSNCHEPFSRHSQTRLCLDCHKEIKADRTDRVGFHGRGQRAATLQCNQCHTDHKGRGADIKQLDRETFDHNQTNFKLVDAHRSVPCISCHAENIRFRKTPSVCFECHKKVDPHQGRLGDKCDNCHTSAKWRETKLFDHDKTKFPLQGAHKDVACATCHVGELYKDLPSTCVSCHRLQDVHADRYGAKCETCHDQSKWKTTNFNHDKTKFPLRGGHARLKCDTCHTGFLYRDKLATTCVSCHRKDDPHKGKLGERCERCHNDTDWRKNLAFDHELTRFPLIGLHASVACEECHRTPAYRDTPTACARCHKDFHQGRLGTGCGNCHNPNGWARWRFDHARQTKFPLTGTHEKIICEACHKAKSPPSLKLATNCNACHSSEDVHRGAFGQDCERCHVATGWRNVNIRN
jgi:hypothetical protein